MNYQNTFFIYRNAMCLVIETEGVVKGFPCYYKYILGSEMRIIAYDLLKVIGEINLNKLRLLFHLQLRI
ncbi:hypothetical protein THERMOT_918 [Bathymodiolus thermophilus thioautotrophic gill symbiont]|jgi:hypothetical protein|uniref:Uncharacterized protein n=1 Tax=Bathymodiolus thermophilus thioautotrophic gill symbiont TaxID=2360 RepID=A0A1J5UIJ7_9GAMM|nr:hypothetical protein [Bathymodiolus thermophilus thioautotrophic gill symbiont]OIR24095.1 hypothetical protein BGC33_09355 [Bathymodiolus thermophilus thioautotrophic gill symbiont]CAB5498746.1 hypothetical protein THERMOT_918 [Bathymodiolus thermophilus thioautotrophic gill symbiont]CAB5501750.1 hypothetical protein THERMOS_1439 [Bathymodiolus thermophilus thioautotrophic gill symbiont]